MFSYNNLIKEYNNSPTYIIEELEKADDFCNLAFKVLSIVNNYKTSLYDLAQNYNLNYISLLQLVTGEFNINDQDIIRDFYNIKNKLKIYF